MKPAAFQFHRPTSVSDATALLHQLGDDAKVLGGGQSLLPIMNMRLAEPAHLIDVSNLAGMTGYSEDENAIVYGGAVTHQMIEDSLVPDACLGLLQVAAAGIGYRAIRCRGTVGGSLAHADSSAEWPTVLTAVGARVRAKSVRGERVLDLQNFFHGFFSTSLEADELITQIEVPRFVPGTRWGLWKTNRKAGEFAESLAVGSWHVDESGQVVDANLWLGAARDVPMNLPSVQSRVTGRRLEEIALEEVREALLADLESDWANVPATERHRIQLHAVTVYRALTATASEEER